MGDKLGDKTGDKSWPRRQAQRGGHSIPDKVGETWREDGRQAGRKGAQEGGHSIPDQVKKTTWETRSETSWETSSRKRTQHPRPGGKDKMGDKIRDKSKTSSRRRTQHPRQGGHIKKALRTPTANCWGNMFFASFIFPEGPSHQTSKRKPSQLELVMPSTMLCRNAATRDFPCHPAWRGPVLSGWHVRIPNKPSCPSMSFIFALFRHHP